MKKLLLLLSITVLVSSCSESRSSLTVEVVNRLNVPRSGELAEFSFSDILSAFNVTDSVQFVILDRDSNEVAYQISYDNRVLFPVNISAGGKERFTVKIAAPKPCEQKVCGRFYALRNDDITWENDKAIYRCFGPAQQLTDEPKYGYDYWCKNTTSLVSEKRYVRALSSETQNRIDSLEQSGNRYKAKLLKDSTDFYHDHGDGLDCFKVGRTLGLAGTALMQDSATMITPNAYNSYEILDNGPLRFSFALHYPPLKVDNDSVVAETRIISLDAGSFMNKVQLSFERLMNTKQLCSAIVMNKREGKDDVVMDIDNGYMAYDYQTVKPYQTGNIYTGAVFTSPVTDIRVDKFKTYQQRVEHDNNYGYLEALSQYVPGDKFVYYFGASWSKCGFESFNSWCEYIRDFAMKAKSPMMVLVY